ncbi:MAG: polysaccharide deacetylase family protein [bacterium]
MIAIVVIGAVIAAVLLLAALAGVWTLYRPADWILSRVSTKYPGIVFRVDTNERAIALTIDDAPNPEVTPGLLEVLRANDAKATFFIIGEYAESHAELLDSIRTNGHELANHLFTDRMSAQLSSKEFTRELLRTDSLIQPLKPPKWCRPGGALLTPRIIRIMSKYGYTPVLGTAYPIDLFAGSDMTVTQFLGNIRPGAILVLHDGGPGRQSNIQVLSTLLPRVREMGYRLVTLTELTRLGKPVVEASAR